MYGAHTVETYTGDMMWADGTTTIIPPILRARSGWWYKPDIAITDKRKTFGMGRDGEKLAQEWHTARFGAAIRKHPGEQPIRISNPVPQGSNYQQNDTWASYMHPIYGEVMLQFTVGSPSYYQKNFNVVYTLTHHRFVDVLTQRNDDARNPWADNMAKRTYRTEVAPDRIEALIEQWRKHPWTAIAQVVSITQQDTAILNPPEQLISPYGLNWSNEVQEVDGVRFQIHKKINRYLGQEVRKTLRESMDHLKELGEVVKYWGVNFRLVTSYEGGRECVVGIEIEVPASTNGHNEEGHAIRITDTGFTVNCGYVRQEQRYQQYEKEKARKLLREFAQEEYEPFEF